MVESARGGGVARALLGEAVHRCKEMEGCYLRLSVAADNLAAQDFYRRSGLAPSDEERLFVLEGDAFDALGKD